MKVKFSLFLQPDYWFFLLSLLLTAWLWSQPGLLTILLLILLFILLRKQSKAVIFYALITGVLGMISEVIVIQFGVWQYALPQWFGVPWWLFCLWALAGMFFRRMQIDLKRFIRK